MSVMKKVLFPSFMIVLSLAACSDYKATNTFNGIWEKVDVKEVGCRVLLLLKKTINLKFKILDYRVEKNSLEHIRI